MWTPWKKKKPAPAPKPDETSKDAAAQVAAATKQLRDRLADVRKQADTSAKLLGGVAVALTGFLSLTQLGDVFPIPSSAWPAAWGGVVALTLGIIAIVGGIGLWLRALGHVSEPVLIREDGTYEGLDGDEATKLAAALTAHASLNGFESNKELVDAVHALEQHLLGYRPADGAGRAEPVVGQSAPSFAGTRTEQVDRLALMKSELTYARVLVNVDIVRARYASVFRSWGAWSALFAAAAGYVALTLSLAYLAGESKGAIDRAQSCATFAKTASEAKADLSSPACEAFVGADEPNADAAAKAAQAAKLAAAEAAYAARLTQATAACAGSLPTALQRQLCKQAVSAIPAAPE